MKKLLLCGIVFICTLFASFAGDSAVFVDNGFSLDGKYYIFGQYGKTDKKFQGWAEIYTVDVIKNDYVSGEVYKTKPSSVTFNKTGKEVFESLMGENYFSIKKYNCSPSEPNQILYIREEEKKSGTDVIEFKDFVSSVSEDQAYYNVTLVPTIYGSGTDVKSSFYIMLEKQDSKGTVLAKEKIGNPDIVRKGVENYKIERIVCDKSGHNLVFIIEKTMEDKTGINIRYMIETAQLKNDFFVNLAEPEVTDSTDEEEDYSEAERYSEAVTENAEDTSTVIDIIDVTDAK